MNTQLQQVNKVAEVIKVLMAGKVFYQSLIEQVNEPDIQHVIGKMIKEHEMAIRELQTFVIPKSYKLHEIESLAVTIANIYAQLIQVITFERMHVFVDLLEELENKTIRVIDSAIILPKPEIYKQYLQRVRVSVRECHDQLKLL